MQHGVTVAPPLEPFKLAAAAPWWLRLLERWAQGRSFRTLSRVGRWIGRAVYYLLPIRRWTIVRRNLARCFPGWNGAARAAVARGAYESLGAGVLELLGATRLAVMNAGDLASVVQLEGRASLDAALARGHGAVIVTAHLGSFDLLACACARMLPGLHVVTKRLHATGVDAWWQRTRAALGVRLHPPEGSMRALLDALRANECVVMMIDQRVFVREGGVQVVFFGHPAETTLAPAVLSTRAGAPLVPARCVREADGRHRVVLEAALDPPARGRAAWTATMQRLTARVEAWVREAPAQWLWLHDRWRRSSARDG